MRYKKGGKSRHAPLAIVRSYPAFLPALVPPVDFVLVQREGKEEKKKTSQYHGTSLILTPDRDTESTFIGPLAVQNRLSAERSKLRTFIDESPAMLRLFSSLREKLTHELPVVLGTRVNLSASGAGVVNAIIAASLFSSNAEFASYGALYGECFLRAVECTFVPVSKFQAPIGYATSAGATTNESSLPMLCVDRHHDQASYSTDTAAMECGSVQYCTTAEQFKHTWRNIESPKSTVMISVASGAIASQAWVPTDGTAASAYTGLIQFITATGSALPTSQVLGVIYVRFDLLYRNRS